MVSFGRSKRVVNLVIEDYVIRMIENNGKNLSSIKQIKEKALPKEVIKDGKIVDEIHFFSFMKNLVREWKIKHRNVRFYVPQSLVILRELDIPEDLNNEEIKQFITMEIGNTIHFPFRNPVFDLYDVPKDNDSNKVTVFAAPEEELIKYTNIFIDCTLKPIAVDVQALGIYRYFYLQQYQSVENKIFLILECNLTSINISIFNNNKVEFIRHQVLNIDQKDWEADNNHPLQWTFAGDKTRLHGELTDQIVELERLMSFYQFSIHQGNKAVTDLIVTGDLAELSNVIGDLKERYSLPIHTLQASQTTQKKVQIPKSFIPALGLALKGEK